MLHKLTESNSYRHGCLEMPRKMRICSTISGLASVVTSPISIVLEMEASTRRMGCRCGKGCVAGPAWAESELALHAGIREGVVRDGKVIGADDKQDRWFFFRGQNGSAQVAIVLGRDRVHRSETPR